MDTSLFEKELINYFYTNNVEDEIVDFIKACLDDNKPSIIPSTYSDKLYYCSHYLFNKYHSELTNNPELELKLIKALFYLLKENTFNIDAVRDLMGKNHKAIFQSCKKYDIPFVYYILFKSDSLNTNIHYMDSIKFILKFNNFSSIYSSYKSYFIEAYNCSNDLSKFFIGVTLYINKDLSIDGLENYLFEYLDTMFIGTLKTSYNNIPYIMEYINGDESYKDQAIDELKLLPSNSYEENVELLIFFLYTLRKYNTKPLRMLNILSLFYTETTLSTLIRLKFNLNRYSDVCDRLFKAKEFILDELLIDESAFILFCAIHYFDCYDDTKNNLFKLLIDYSKNNKEVFFKSCSLSRGNEKIILDKLRIDLQDSHKKSLAIKELYIDNMSKLLHECEFSTAEIDSFISFMNDEIELKSVLVKSGFKNQYLWSGNIRHNIKPIIWFHNDTDLFIKILAYVVHLGHGKLFDYVLDEFISEKCGAFKDFMFKLSFACPNLEDIIYFITYNIIDGHYHKECETLLNNWIKIMPLEVIKHIGLCPAEARIIILNMFKDINFMEQNKDKYLELLCTLCADSSKAVREEALNIMKISLDEDTIKTLALSLMKHKKANNREAGITLLLTLPIENISDYLKNHLETEKSSKLRNLILENLILEDSSNNEDPCSNYGDIESFCKDNLNARKKSKLKWIDFSTLSPLILESSKEVAKEETLQYILISFAENKDIKINTEIKSMESNFSKDSLANIAYDLLIDWCNKGASSKDKWVLSFIGMYGDFRTIDYLNKQIRNWPEVSRTAIACEALKALAINGSNSSLLFLDSIASKFKFKKVKTSAMEALDFAASELNIDKEELCDKLIPSLGFDKDGKQIFDYGNRKFTTEIDKDLNIIIFNEDNKKLKNLPAIGANDHTELATKAREDFKLLKKQLKEVIKHQTLRLDLALSMSRVWSFEKWKDLFVDNIIMNKFAIGLIWGVYEDGTLKESFRYMDDGSFNSSTDDEVCLNENSLIGLVHPIELSEEELSNWKEQLEDYEISQPIIQLHRKIFCATEDKNSDDTFAGIKVSGLSLSNKLLNRNWCRGSVRDGGWFSEFYKEIPKLGIGAELEFSGMGVGYYDDEDPIIFYLRFYNAGTVSRGSYVYDSILDKDLIKPSNVNKRLFSEILYDIHMATEKNLGTDPDWKKELKGYSNYKDL